MRSLLCRLQCLLEEFDKQFSNSREIRASDIALGGYFEWIFTPHDADLHAALRTDQPDAAGK